MQAVALRPVSCDMDGGARRKEFSHGDVLEGVSEDQVESLIRVGFACSRDDFEAMFEGSEDGDRGSDEFEAEPDEVVEPGSVDEPTGDVLVSDMPETAAELVAWIGNDPERAEEALAGEHARDKPRSSVVKHAEAVLLSDS